MPSPAHALMIRNRSTFLFSIREKARKKNQMYHVQTKPFSHRSTAAAMMTMREQKKNTVAAEDIFVHIAEAEDFNMKKGHTLTDNK